MQAIDLDSQRRHMIGSRRPVTQSRADTPHPMNKSMTDGIASGSLQVTEQNNHLADTNNNNTMLMNVDLRNAS